MKKNPSQKNEAQTSVVFDKADGENASTAKQYHKLWTAILKARQAVWEADKIAAGIPRERAEFISDSMGQIGSQLMDNADRAYNGMVQSCEAARVLGEDKA